MNSPEQLSRAIVEAMPSPLFIVGADDRIMDLLAIDRLAKRVRLRVGDEHGLVVGGLFGAAVRAAHQ